MTALEQFRWMARYNRWMNERLYGLCADLDGELAYTSMVNPAPRRIAMRLAVAHFFNHRTHHRGQVTTLLSQRGIDPGVTDLLWTPME